ncbi:MAG: 2Fe-2S iron-sulfur cluster-binding protein [Acidobacteriota bacterium]|nr:2Fe-2S iron-sulfur cluster-binding protein [Acidobacteriota bacterium]
MSGGTLFEAFLNQHDGKAWAGVLQSLLPAIHEVDRNAVQIWFYFFPIDLARALQQVEDKEQLEKKLLLRGKFYLKDQIDSSHEFLYGHRYWPAVKKAVEAHACSSKAPSSLDLAAQIREVAAKVASELKVEESLLIGITAVGFMTLQQVGIEAFKSAPGKINLDPKVARRTPQQVLAARAKDNGQGLFGFLRTVDKRWNITFNENKPECVFKLINMQDLAMAAASDKRNYRLQDPRCIEGPIPVECRSAACGTCWIGILGGAEKLSPMDARERKKLAECGYIEAEGSHPLIRLACITAASGAVSIVIPPWNGVFGKYLRSLKEREEQRQAV